jgi:arylsulfatase A-like enzyme
VKKRFTDLAAAALVLGVMQAVVESLLLAFLHRDLLLAPYRFFPTHAWDAFTKLYFLAADRLPLPMLLQDFVGQSLAAKLVIAPALVAINAAVALVLAVVLAPLSLATRQGRERDLALVVAACVVVHLACWTAAFQAPEVVTGFKLVRAVARDLLQGGAAMSLGVLALSAVLARVVLASPKGTLATAAGGLVLALAAALPLAGAVPDATARVPAEAAPAPAKSPVAGDNVILVSIDSLRADHLGAYGYGRDTSPAIDSVARGGVLFRHHQSTTSWTLPAHMSLLTARSLLGHGVVSDDRSLSPSVATVAEVFRQGGYETHAIVSAPYLNSRYGFARGFDEYDDKTIHFETNEDSYHSVTAPKLLKAAEDFLGQKRDKPFFLFLHFWDVHYDYAPGKPYDTMFDPSYTGTVTGDNFYFDPKINKDMDKRDLEHLVALYDGEIRLVDDHIARLKADLARLAIDGNTMIAIVGDHGDEFFEHGNKGHHRTLYEEVLATPFVLEVPGHRPSKTEVGDEVSLVDVAPTLLGLCGLPQPDGAEGRDWSGLWTGAPLPAADAIFAELYRTGTRNVQVAELDARHKVIHHFQQRSLEAYDLAADPGEQKSLSRTGPLATPLVSRMRDWLDGRWHRFDKRLRGEGIEPVILDAKARDELKALGYLQ